MSLHINLGKQGETVACAYLVDNGYKIIERNFRKPWGEIDIVAQCKDGTLIFVEVKTLKTTKDDISQELQPEDQLTKSKLLKLQKTASLYANHHPEFINEEKGWRIDLLCLALNGKNFETRYYENI